MKKILFLLFLLLLAIFFNNNGVLAIGTGPTIDTSGTGGSGQVSATCNGERCANTVGLTITNDNWQNTNVSVTKTFSKTAIFGMRITIVDKNNNKISKYDTKNFWATDDMRDIIRYNNVNVRRNNSYSNITDPTGKLYAQSSYLRELDLGKGTYASFINSLNADDVEKILKKINSSLTLTIADDLDYYLKIEPIFVFHYKNASYAPYNHYFAGTVSEILYMITNDNYVGGSQFSSFGINYYSLGAISCGNMIFNGSKECNAYGYSGDPIIFQENYNVLRNFIISIYMKDMESGTSFPYYGSDATLKDTKTLYKDVMKVNSALSVGYISVRDFEINDVGNVYVYKYSGETGTVCYKNDVEFELKPIGVSGATSKTLKRRKGDCGVIKFEDVVPGDYQLIEKNVDSDKIDTVYFKMRDSAGVYYIHSISSTATTSQAESKTFKVLSGKNVYLRVYNSEKDTCEEGVDYIFENYSEEAERGYNLIMNYIEYFDKNIEISNMVNFGNPEIKEILTKSYEQFKSDNDAAKLCSSTIKTPTDTFACTGSSESYYNGAGNLISIESGESYIASSDSVKIPDFDNDYGYSYCYVSLDKNLNFNNSEVKAGKLLWFGNDIGDVKVLLHCDGYYKTKNITNSVYTYSNNIKDYIHSLVPVFQVEWTSDNKTNTQDVISQLDSIVYNEITYTADKNVSIKPKLISESDTEGGYSHLQWEVAFNYKLMFEKIWYAFGNKREFITLNEYNRLMSVNSSDRVKYKKFSRGLPIDVEDETGLKSARITFGSVSVDCPYSVINEILTPDGDDLSTEFNFKFRVVDPYNPFPGLDGSSNRLTGHNWCVSSRIGTVKYDADNNMVLVGDLDGNGEIDGNDLKGEADFENNLLAGDINGDGVITYVTNCAGNSLADNCILSNYLSNNSLDCASDNSIVNKYIINAKSSQSTDLPMYSFTLTSAEILAIRTYNSIYSYSDFNMSCNDGNYCLSNFISNWINDKKIVVSNGYGFNRTTNISVATDSTNSSCYLTRSGRSGKWCSNN